MFLQDWSGHWTRDIPCAMSGTGLSYSVQVLLPRWMPIDVPSIVSRLRQWRGEVEVVSWEHALVLSIPTGDLPLIVRMAYAAPDAYAGQLSNALTWSRMWHETWDDIARRCPESIVIEMTAQRPIHYASFLLAFLAVLDTLVFSFEPVDRDASIIHWMPAQQLLTFERYLRLRTDLGPCGPAVNIRIANATGRPGELLADTVGLAELGLPDLQIVFSDRDPAEVILRLQLLVRNMFVGDRLDCQWIEEPSFVPPERDALTLQLD